MKNIKKLLGVLVVLPIVALSQDYPIAGTNQTTYFDNYKEIEAPLKGSTFYGQNASYLGNTPSYTNNGDGTVTDNVTGLMWQQSFDHNQDGSINVDDKLTYKQIINQFGSDKVKFAGYNDWRIPTIKEMYSLMLFSGRDTSPQSSSTDNLTPFIDNKTFAFAYGDLDGGERLIDMQCATTNVYVSNEVEKTVFGVNFADGRIKGYGLGMPGGRGYKTFNYLLVRSNTSYGINNFIDNKDGTIIDKSTGLMWEQNDNNKAVLWQDALVYAEDKEFAGYSDWRLPNAKELQSIVDYSRSPATTNSAAIDPLFNCTQITNEAGEEDYPWYWSNTTHARDGKNTGAAAVYVAFGKSLGNMPKRPFGPRPGANNSEKNTPKETPKEKGTTKNETINWTDVHGAGSQRSDPKMGDPNEFSEGHGPQGDAVRGYNYVRLVRDVK